MGCLLTKKTIIDISNQLESNGEKVVFTHGAYDLFHIGHTTFLKKSKKKGDFLIVGVESDERVARYKNPGRPFMPLEERLRVLADFVPVDFVFPIDRGSLDEKYYLSLYDRLNPRIVTFGKHFKFSKQMHKSFVDKDIKFKRISHKFDGFQSTSKLIQKIQEGYDGNTR